MWENAAPMPEQEPPKPPVRRAKSEEELVLWAQLLISLAAVGFVLAVRVLGLPAYAKEESYTPDFALCFPLPESTSRKTSGYGWRTDPMGGLGTDFHIGNDLAAAEGTPVLAAADGVVRIAGSHKSYGSYLRLLHADGDETLYAHMQYLFVKAGETVTAGQILGTVGETGNATGPHLHFEILHKGLRYDPAQALQDAF